MSTRCYNAYKFNLSCPVEYLNLRYIEHLKSKYPNKEIGYSGHEYGLNTSYAAVAMGSTWVGKICDTR